MNLGCQLLAVCEVWCGAFEEKKIVEMLNPVFMLGS